MRLEDLKRFEGVEVEEAASLLSLSVSFAVYVELCRYLRDGQRYDLLSDLTAIDFGLEASPRFLGVVHLYHTDSKDYVRIKVPCGGSSTDPFLPTLSGLYPSANWHEREAFDMFGIRYLGHPDLRRILMWEGYAHYPLRKDFPLAGVEGSLPSADVAEQIGDKILAPAPMAGGPFKAPQGSTMKAREPLAADESWSEEHPKPPAL